MGSTDSTSGTDSADASTAEGPRHELATLGVTVESMGAAVVFSSEVKRLRM